MATAPAAAAMPAGTPGHAFSSLFRAVGGLRNWRAIVALVSCTVAGILVAFALYLTSGALGVLAGLLAFLVYAIAVGTGVNAAGLLHMDDARGVAPRSIVDAIVGGLMCIPKLVVLALALIAVEIVFFIALALILVICKIPYLGPLLFTVVFPLAVIAAGVTICGLFLCLLMSLPAIWQGATIMRALAQTLAIARSRLIEAVLLLLGVGFLAFAVALVIFGVLGIGLLPTLGMSAGIIGIGGGMGGGLGSVMGMMQGFGGSGHAVAGMVGGFVLWALAGSLVGQVYLLGLCIVYLRVTDGLDPGATEAALRERLDDARRRTAELGEKARNAARERAPGAAAGSAAGAAATSAFETTAAPGYYVDPPAMATPPGMTTAPVAPGAAAAPVSAWLPPAAAAESDADIALPFDEAPAPPPAWSPPVYQAPPPVAQPMPPAAASPPAAMSTACPQCLSAVTGEDVFCGVCGYRLK